MRQHSKAIRSLAAVLVIAAAATACQQREASAPDTAAPVRIVAEQVRLVEDTLDIETVGSARAAAYAALYPESDGVVTEVNFRAGDPVRKGDVLLRLEDREQRLAVQRAEVALADARQQYQRVEQLSAPSAVPQSQIDSARIAVQAAEIELALARDALDERTVRAPFTGYVGISDIDPGARITTQTLIAELDQRNPLFVDFDVPEQVFGKLAVGDEISITPFSATESSFTATIATIGSRISSDTRSFTIRAVVNNDADNLRPGMSFAVSLSLPGQRYPSIPEAAIVWGGDGAYLWAVDQQRAKRVPVTIISRDQGRVLVRAPLAEGSWIVAEGVQKVREGTPLQDVNGYAGGDAEQSGADRGGNALQ